ncbi:hypothetical protein B0H19DRAFT_495224 [Mycena capillaripes]|nr:hypothetical protein B0H19DRAFT_495224 [Mycena capillaripes]
MAPKHNVLKRAVDSENRDDSSIEMDPRPLKKARIHPAVSPQQLIQELASRIQSPAPSGSAVLPISIFPNRAGRTIFYPSPANSSPLKTPNNPKPALHANIAPLQRIDFTAFKPTPALPVLSFPRPRPARRLTANARTNVNGTNNAQLAANPPRPTIAALLRAPRAKACVFEVTEMYRGKVFSCVKIPRA